MSNARAISGKRRSAPILRSIRIHRHTLAIVSSAQEKLRNNSMLNSIIYRLRQEAEKPKAADTLSVCGHTREVQ